MTSSFDVYVVSGGRNLFCETTDRVLTCLSVSSNFTVSQWQWSPILVPNFHDPISFLDFASLYWRNSYPAKPGFVTCFCFGRLLLRKLVVCNRTRQTTSKHQLPLSLRHSMRHGHNKHSVATFLFRWLVSSQIFFSITRVATESNPLLEHSPLCGQKTNSWNFNNFSTQPLCSSPWHYATMGLSQTIYTEPIISRNNQR